MSEQMCIILKFLSLVEGNWRNAVYIDACDPSVCKEEGPCGGHLFTTDADGAPVLIPAALFRRLTGEPVDPAECGGRLSRPSFEQLYHRTLLWLTPSASHCGVRALAAAQPLPPCVSRPGGTP